MRTRATFLTLGILAATLTALHVGAPAGGTTWEERPVASADQPPSAPGNLPLTPAPGRMLEPGPVRQPPKMDGTAASVESFIAWAVASTDAERELGRAVIVAAGGDARNIALLDKQLARWRDRDVTRALVILTIIGEIRSPQAEALLAAFMDLKPTPTGIVVDGEDAAQTALGMLQAKAVDGLAYQGTASADGKVLQVAGTHPDIAVRSEAMVAYLWNHGGTAEARQKLLAVVRPDENRSIDRIVRLPSDDSASFNAKVAAFLKTHPEAEPPVPEKSK